MDYKKRYEVALERARKFSEKPLQEDSADIVEYIFPELKKSEDEQIRKELIAIYSVGAKVNAKTGDIPDRDIVAWLEKQGKKKPYEWHSEDEQNLNAVLAFIEDECLRRWLKDVIHTEYDQCSNCINDKSCVTCVNGNMKETKSEPKFHEGDWIISNDKKSTYQVIEVKRGIYVIRDNADNHEYHIGIEECEKSGRLWTIQDAKDGDVLAWDNSKCIALFKNIYDEDSFNSYGLVGHCTGIFEPRQSYHDIKGAHPATKEQRDLLFQKMNEAGYEWDVDKKELKKIESKKLDPDEVIAWLVANICDFEYYVKLFKQDFGL